MSYEPRRISFLRHEGRIKHCGISSAYSRKQRSDALTSLVMDGPPGRHIVERMTIYAVAHLQDVDLGPEIVDYLERIDATLEPFGGRFVIHGGQVEVMEGEWPGDLVVIGFPDREGANVFVGNTSSQSDNKATFTVSGGQRVEDAR